MAEVLATAGGSVRAVLQLEEVEVALLRSLALQMIDFVGPTTAASDDPLAAMVGIDPLARTPDDPALRRLLPDAYLDDDDAAGEFRRFTERDLRESKVASARVVLGALDGSGRAAVPIGTDEMGAWLGFLNDTRLTLGARLDLTEANLDELAELPDDDPRSGLFQVYDWLTFVQESLVQVMLSPS